ncbi:MAG: thiamine-phosphate kinase [Acidilobus sp.]
MRREDEVIRVLAEAAGNSDLLDVDAWGPDGILVNIDGYSASRSRLPFMSWEDWGYKATVASASDVIASGGRPIAIAFSLGASSFDVLISTSRGVGQAAAKIGARVYKGDANRSEGDIWIDVAVVGTTQRPVRRSGARPGDVVVQVGYVGYGSVAAKVLESRLDARAVPRSVVDRIRRPELGVHVAELISRHATSSSDNSDGWAATLHNIASSSGVRIDLERVVIDPSLSGLVSEDEAVHSWEDYSIAVTVPTESAQEFISRCGGTCWQVGIVREGEGVYLRGARVKPIGWSWW